MDGYDVNEPSENQLTYTEVFEYAFPYCLAIGMTAEQYWDGDCHLVQAYIKAKEIAREEANEWAWWQGYYNHIGVSIALSNAFAKKGSKPLKFPNKPFEITPKSEEETKAKAKKDTEDVIHYLNKLKQDWDKSHTGATSGDS